MVALACFVIERSATGARTTVAAVAVLLAGLGSGSLPETVTVSVILPVTVGVTEMVKVALIASGREPAEQVTFPCAWVHDPAAPAAPPAEPKVTPGGSWSVSTTPDVATGPLRGPLSVAEMV